MIHTLIATFLFATSASAAPLWTCKVLSTSFTNQPVVFTGMATTKGLAQVRAMNKCQLAAPLGLKPCKPGTCERH